MKEKFFYHISIELFDNVIDKIIENNPIELQAIIIRLRDDIMSHNDKNNAEVLELLDKKLTAVIDNISSETRTLLNTPNLSQIAFWGRDDELKDIDNRLSKSNFMFLECIGGIGKSELARKYPCDERYKSQYDTVQLLHFNKDLKSTIATRLKFSNFNYEYFNTKYKSEEKELHIYEEKINLLSRYDERTLISILNCI